MIFITIAKCKIFTVPFSGSGAYVSVQTDGRTEGMILVSAPLRGEEA